MNSALECIFAGAKKKSDKSKAKSSKSTKSKAAKKSGKSVKSAKKSMKKSMKKSAVSTGNTSSYCYKCNSMTLDKQVSMNNKVRDSQCGKCTSKRSVFIS